MRTEHIASSPLPDPANGTLHALIHAHLTPLIEREWNARGSIILLAATTLLAILAAAFQVRVQQHGLMSLEMWSVQPLGNDPAALIAGWMAAILAFRLVISRADGDRESGWLSVLHAEGFPAWLYAVALWVAAILLACLAILLGYAAIAVTRLWLPVPEWAPGLDVRRLVGALFAAANLTALGLLAVTLVRGAARTAGLALLFIAAPFAIFLISVSRGAPLPDVPARLLALCVPPLLQSGPWKYLLVQLTHTALLLALVLGAAGNRLTRLP